MHDHFYKIQEYLLDLKIIITKEDAAEHYFVINGENNGIQNMVIYVEDPIVVLEQFIFDLPSHDPAVLVKLLQINRSAVHGALALDDTGKRVIYRDTLQVDTLDFNELEASINSLSLLLSEHANTILESAGVS